MKRLSVWGVGPKMALTTTLMINAVPEEIFDTIIETFSSEANYKMWHEDHVTCKWLR